MKKILVTGANGQLGSELRIIAEKRDDFVFTDIPELDICDYGQMVKFVDEQEISTIINCAAYTNVNKAETEEELAHKINAEGPATIAAIALEKDLTLVHISTDYVFDGNKHTPYHESDQCHPQTVYGRTKREGEIAIKKSGCKGIIIRTAWLYSSFGTNFVKTMIHLSQDEDFVKVVSDQYGTPTYAKDLAQAILDILPQLDSYKRYGEVFHYTNEGVCSWFDFATKIMKLTMSDCQVLPITTEEYPSTAVRPKYSVLDKSLINAAFGIKPPLWEKSLSHCLRLLRHQAD